MTHLETIVATVTKKDNKSLNSLLVYGFLGGVFIAFGGLLALVISGNLPSISKENPGLIKFIFGALFPLGLILVVISGAELFTGNTSYYPSAILHNKSTFLKQFRNWSLIYCSNFIGALFVAYLLTYKAQLLGEGPIQFIEKMALSKVSMSFDVAFFRAIGCNWLVCLALWMSLKTENVAGKVLLIWFPIMAFVAIGMEHCIANQFFIPLAMFYDANITLSQFFINNLLPVTLGNILGGAFFVGTLYFWADYKEQL